MRGLLLKDFLNLKSQGKIYLFLLFAFGVLSFLQKDFGFIGGVLCLLAATLPMTTLSYDERAKWDKYGLTMPVSRTTMVIEKYLLGLFSCSAAFLISLLLGLLSSGDFRANFIIALTFFSLSIIVSAMILPFIYRFGVEKGRLFMIFIFLFPLFFSLLGQNINLGSLNFSIILNLIVYSPLFALCFWGLSLLFSLRIYRKKEF